MELLLDSVDDHVHKWVQHHFHTVAPPHASTHQRVVMEVVVGEDRVSSFAADFSGAHQQVESYAGHNWVCGEHQGSRAWTHRPSSSYGTQLVLVERSESEWLLVAGSAGDGAAAAVRIARELLRTLLAEMGAHTFHASLATDSDRVGLLVLGPQGAGKTTLALAAGQRGCFISSDQVELVVRANQPPLAVGFPWSIRIREGTQRWLQLPASTPRLRGSAGGFSPRSEEPDVAELTMQECASLLGISTAATATVGTLIFTRPSSDDDPRMEEVEPDILPGLLSADSREPDPAFPEFWLAERNTPGPAAASVAEIAAALVHIPTAVLSWDPKRHNVDRVLDLLVDWRSR